MHTRAANSPDANARNTRRSGASSGSPLTPSAPLTMTREPMHFNQYFHYKTWTVLRMTLSSQDSRKLFKGDGGIRSSLHLNSEMRMNAHDMCNIGPGVAHV